MPIYEYYCPDCHMVLNFYARRMNPQGKPICPHCDRADLDRQVSLFAAGHGGGDEEDDAGLPPGFDESRMERAMEALAGEADSLNEDDPRAAAQLMRKFSKMAGMEYNESIEDALQRLEAGEDPEAIEAEMGEAFDGDDPFVPAPGHATKSKQGKKRQHLRHDPNLYDWPES